MWFWSPKVDFVTLKILIKKVIYFKNGKKKKKEGDFIGIQIIESH